MDQNTKTACKENIIPTSYGIDDIIRLLNYNGASDDIDKGIQLAREVKCIKAFFQPYCTEYGKETWENCAKIICEHSDAELEFYVEDMIKWLQDINWPGAEIILNRLIEMNDSTILLIVLEKIVPVLCYVEDIQWLTNLSQLLNNQYVFAKIKENTKAILLPYLSSDSC